MTLFIYEHLTSGAMLDIPPSASLLEEGDAMLLALCEDLNQLGHSLSIMRDTRLPALPSSMSKVTVYPVSSSEEYAQQWLKALSNNHQSLIIAPETDGTLEQLIIQLEQKDRLHLNCNRDAIALSSDKLRFARFLTQHHIQTPDTYLPERWLTLTDNNEQQKWVIKPRDGAGCENTHLFSTVECHDFIQQHHLELSNKVIIQPYIDGETLSLSLFYGKKKVTFLSINEQKMTLRGNELHLLKVSPTQHPPISHAVAEQLINHIHAVIPGLFGFVGVDLIKNTQGLWVIELNPRLTSAYVAPEMRSTSNPAQLLEPYLS
jgi:predicted ATP-grasp superfamily ATP-dependent carboligase